MKATDLVFRLKSIFFKNFITITVKMEAKKASLHIYGIRQMFNFVTVCIFRINESKWTQFRAKRWEIFAFFEHFDTALTCHLSPVSHSCPRFDGAQNIRPSLKNARYFAKEVCVQKFQSLWKHGETKDMSLCFCVPCCFFRNRWAITD